MIQLNSPVEILKLLDQSNCGECGKPTCLSFAAAVFKGSCQLSECPELESDVIEQYSVKDSGQQSVEQRMEELLVQLKQRICQTDLSSAARRLGAEYADGKLTVQCLGKNVSVDTEGNIITDIHVHPWIAIPVYKYILDAAGTPASGEWITFRELKGGNDRYPLYQQMCERPLRNVADTYTELFDDMLHVFRGKRIDYHYPADISIVLHPLPRVPVLICYSAPEDGLESSLTIFYDSTAEENLDIELIYGLAIGMVRMFEKIALRHGQQ
jgi:hypothetical protein